MPYYFRQVVQFPYMTRTLEAVLLGARDVHILSLITYIQL